MADASVVPDLMNDPAYDPNSTASDKASEDPDTCRICRGEGSLDEPLFFPCKCSGSIKFVHQECLMEWLSHSQKKHCELCKTPFRFTKLYHPQMPSTLPTSVFLRRALIHVVNHFITWARGLLVGTVWLVGLPWFMRIIWRALFWCGDGGFATDLARVANIHRHRIMPHLNADPANRTSLPLNMTALSALPAILSPFSQTLNMSAGEPTVFMIVKRILFGFYPVNVDVIDPKNSTTTGATQTHGSLLSDVSFFKKITSSPRILRFVLDVVEGEIITVLVVIAFILIFLIREWVVQQQPVINVAAMQPMNRPVVPPAVEEEVQHEAPNDPAQDANAQQDRGEQADGSESDDSQGSAEAFPMFADFEYTPEEDDRQRGPRQMPEFAQKYIDEIPDANVRQALRDADPRKLASIIDRMDLVGQKIIRRELCVWLETISRLVRSTAESDRRTETWEQLLLWASDFKEIIVTPQETERYGTPSIFIPGALDADESSLSTDSDLPDSLLAGNEYQRARQRVSAGRLTKAVQRPNMPSREQSFLAAQIRRDLEEATRKALLDNAGEGPAIEPDGERHSDNSEESWQQISDSEAVAALTANSITPDADYVYSSAPRSSRPSTSFDEAHPTSEELYGDANEDEGGADDQDHSTSHSHTTTVVPPNDESDAPPTYGPEPAPARDNQAGASPANAESTRALPVRDVGFWESVYNWLYGDILPVEHDDVQLGGDDAHVVQNLAEEAPFVGRDAAFDEEFDQPGAAQDPEVAAAAAQAGIDLNDAEAIEDAEDLEGIMELIGMQGPILGLFQNAIFSAVLISATVAVAVWIPYLWGKVVLLSLGRPVWLFLKLPLRILSAGADLIVDSSLFLGAAILYWSLTVLTTLLPIAMLHQPFESLATSTQTVAESAVQRISRVFTDAGTSMNSDYLHLSISSHAALRSLQRDGSEWMSYLWTGLVALYEQMSHMESFSVFGTLGRIFQATLGIAASAITNLRAALPTISTANGLSVTLPTGNSTVSTVDPTFEYWTATDRIIAILAGYVFFAFAGALYLKRGTPFTSSPNGRRVEVIISDVLQQAGGVLKVILIISIEMLAFPLYCGILLDVALLPLFEDTTLISRFEFAHKAPWTAGFVHWFVGTCYMFHFALFVSMCRKIMRTGVLYFIRDPDDPTFHPVRDVLERSVTSQLRKIAFSAFVYGALVICCLGGVVWSLYLGFDNILPVHWESHAPAMEFPIELLFFNFLTPVVLRLFKPSDSLHEMYQWWFRKCARGLRLSDFLFGEKFADERGHHVRRTWAGWFARKKGNAEAPVTGEERRVSAENRNTEAYFLFDGRYVRAPASDQVRIPRGQSVFVDVDTSNNRLDGKSDDDGVHGRHSGLTSFVYIPPWFRVRICLFVLAIWLFAAVTGVGVTVVPLLFGRSLIASFLPDGTTVNDIYAFSIGIYIFGFTAYTILHFRQVGAYFARSLQHPVTAAYSVLHVLVNYATRALATTYVYAAVLVALPILFAAFLEFYILVPLHAYLAPQEEHVIHLIQDWTLGFLYARVAVSVLLWNPRNVLSRALRAVVRDGYARPDARLATRCFVVPAVVFFATTLLGPLLLARIANATIFAGRGPWVHHVVYRTVYPLMLAVALGVWACFGAVRTTDRWRARVRDEVYLIGERLHNLGERKTALSGALRQGQNQGSTHPEPTPVAT
ncbi:uncharacterized protein K452DRAFT_290263 [Aplosporella prunicola CBS 121167]|uniref:RING-type E3 ubiquitin transferase n=1 Tax=Aplosporella prunicola CBS 121167 TaxID=1176127 RepID=A0A6A6B4T9_9PEZI|nr:uncharacterized protein K452DRAFT_290263 [Aplosporella prunicola CBS 121167]KAF2139162.1 hypothetical protein K452DRAFT_290263 [Aplosporella prunicola CBS 121167]